MDSSWLWCPFTLSMLLYGGMDSVGEASVPTDGIFSTSSSLSGVLSLHSLCASARQILRFSSYKSYSLLVLHSSSCNERIVWICCSKLLCTSFFYRLCSMAGVGAHEQFDQVEFTGYSELARSMADLVHFLRDIVRWSVQFDQMGRQWDQESELLVTRDGTCHASIHECWVWFFFRAFSLSASWWIISVRAGTGICTICEERHFPDSNPIW